MNINKPIQPEEMEKIQQASRIIVAKLTEMFEQKSNSVHGYQPNRSGRYPQGHGSDKEKLEQLGQFIEIFRLNEADTNKYSTVEEFLEAKFEELRNFPDAVDVYDKLMALVNAELGLQLKAKEGPTGFYFAWIEVWSERFEIEKEWFEKNIPWELFNKLASPDLMDIVLAERERRLSK